VFLISIEIDLLTSNQKRKNGQYDRGVCVCYEPLLGFFFQKMILFSKRLCVCECFSLVYPIACLIFLSLSSLSRVYSCTVSFFFKSLILCVCVCRNCFATLIHFQTKISPLQLVVHNLTDGLCFIPSLFCLWRVVEVRRFNRLPAGLSYMDRVWDKIGTKPKQVDWIDDLHFFRFVTFSSFPPASN
jgi:hypothetical protein